jgi:PAS domain S-box-containing protein
MNQQQLSKITKALKNNPRGMTVTEIAKEINLNRNSVAKYLEVLLISGHVEMRTFGPAKVFFLAQRVPMSALIDFSSDYIIILDRDLKTIQANDNFLKLIENETTNIIGQKLENISIPVFNTPEIQSDIKAALNGKRVTKEIEFPLNEKKCYFNVKIIPTTFEDGLPGVTMILEDITERKKMEKELMLLSNAVKMSTDSIVITDMDTVILEVNDATVEMYNATNKKDLIGKKAFELIKPVEQKKASFAMNELMKKGSKKIVQFKVYTLDGTQKFLEVSLGLMKDDNNKPIGLVAISREISEERKTN